MAESTPPEHPERIGPYQILQLIGEGGMGVVYEAQQVEPVRRRVALKMLKAGVDTNEVVRRFGVERQALAVMDHPGIAKVFDAGSTELGRPYFVMELVRGVRIDEYCDQHQLSTEERVRLFIEVCEAVQHAHQKGVIHRDLKPSNVLVSEDGGRPHAKVIDFGVAKATGQRLTGETVVTTYGQALGTLAYMSPEQAVMSGLDVDTRADIYSLGVTLYQLLTGTVPVDPSVVGASAFLAQLIQRDHTMPTLTRRLTELPADKLHRVARLRGTDASGLQRELSGDVRVIVQKAMDKDRARRYETANGLAMDLKRYLAHEPVFARAPSAAYRAAMFVRRNRPAVAAAAVAVLAVVGGGVAATVGMVRALRAEAAASQEATTARQVSDFLVDVFRVSNPDRARGAEITARELLDTGADRIEQELADQPVVQARLMRTMAEVYEGLGHFEPAEALGRRALDTQRRELGDADREVGVTLAALAGIVEERGDPTQAVELYREALGILEATLGQTHEETAGVINNLAGVHITLAEYDQALPMLERSLAIKVGSFGPRHPEVASALYNLAVLHRREERFDTAVALYRRALGIRERALGADHPAVARTLNGLAITHTQLAQYDSAEALYRRSLADKERVLGPQHPDLANTLNNLGILFAYQDRNADAEEMFTRAYEIRLGALGADHPEVAESLNNLGNIQRRAGGLDRAASSYRRAIEVYERTLGPDHPRVAETLGNYATVLRELGREAEADAADARADAILRERGG